MRRSRWITIIRLSAVAVYARFRRARSAWGGAARTAARNGDGTEIPFPTASSEGPSSVMEDRVMYLLRFWFGRVPDSAIHLRDVPKILGRFRYWYRGSGRYDAELRREFIEDHTRAARGEYDAWAETSLGRLALIVLLDQITRNIYRRMPESYAQDEKSLALARRAIAKGDDLELNMLGRAFIYVPLMHTEDLGTQDECVRLLRQLWRDTPYVFRPLLAVVMIGSRRHRQIIRRFGRFPHRNRILRRTTTREEQSFLRHPFSSF